MLEAKLLSCSEWGIANLKGTLNELENLSRIYSSRNAQISTEIIQR